MNFCSGLQKKLADLHPGHGWLVVENSNPSTSVIILAQGQAVPGEFIVKLLDGQQQTRAQIIVRGQEFCDFIKGGKSESDYAAELGRRLLNQAG